MTSLDVIVPVLNRPQQVKPTINTVHVSTALEQTEGWTVKVVFVCTPGDRAEINMVRHCNHQPLMCESDKNQYAKKTNLAAATSDADWLFLGADDLDFQTGWLREAINCHIRTGKLVIGTQDQGNSMVKRGEHATHSLVHRDYLKLGTIDDPSKLLHDGYDHNAVDVEFVETAISRDQFAFCEASIVTHRHPLWFPREVRRDQTYQKGMRNARSDRILLGHRRHLWKPAAVRPRGPRIVKARPAPIAYWPDR